MTLRVGINGFGRTGRQAFRAWFENRRGDFEIVAINRGPVALRTHLLRYDSDYGRFPAEIIDGTDSFKAGHVPGAIDFRAQKAQLAKLLPGDKSALVVASCGGPTCNASSAAAKAAKELGYTNVKHLSAGISGWKAANAPLEAAK